MGGVGTAAAVGASPDRKDANDEPLSWVVFWGPPNPGSLPAAAKLLKLTGGCELADPKPPAPLVAWASAAKPLVGFAAAVAEEPARG